jgi:hypothetical protein
LFHITSQLNHKYAAEMEDIITSPSYHDPYTALKTELLNRLSPTREHRARQIITHEVMGDRKPSQFLRHLRSLAPDLLEYFLRSIWCSRLPRHVQTALAGQPEIGLDAAARCAMDSPRRSSRVLADLPTTPRSCMALRNSLARWRLLALSGTTTAPASGTVATTRQVALPLSEIAISTTIRPPA